MRDRLASAKPPQSAWDAKNGPGRLMDIELLAQSCALRAGNPTRRVESQLRTGVKCYYMSQSDEQTLLDAYRLCWHLQAGSRLLTDKALDMDQLGTGARAFLLRETGQNDVEGLSRRLSEVLGKAEAVISRILAGA
jgi:glutamate-ammonia-ligase adenylyltransferase